MYDATYDFYHNVYSNLKNIGEHNGDLTEYDRRFMLLNVRPLGRNRNRHNQDNHVRFLTEEVEDENPC